MSEFINNNNIDGNSPIFYLAHPYSNNPECNYQSVCFYMDQLLLKGLTVFSPIHHTHHYDLHAKACLTEEAYQKINYIEWDLKLITGFMKWDGHQEFKHYMSDQIWQSQKYDSGIILLLHKSAYEENMGDFETVIGEGGDPTIYPNPNRKCINWLSEGCRQEYNFAKKHHIRVLDLDAFINKKEIEL